MEFDGNNQIYLYDINGGQRYVNGDVLDAEAINRPIEASYYAQELSKQTANSVVELEKQVEELSKNPPSSSGVQWRKWNYKPISNSGSTIEIDMSGNPEILEKASWFKFIFYFTQNNHYQELVIPSYSTVPENGLSDGTYYRKTMVPYWVIHGMFVYHAPVVVEITSENINITVSSTDSVLDVNCYVFYQLGG